jgi:GTP-binding protein
MLYKPRMVALSKIDLLPEAERPTWIAEARQAFPRDVEVYPISAVAQVGLQPLKHGLWNQIRHERAVQADL